MNPELLNRKDVLSGKVCPYCGNPTEYVDSKEVYEKSYGNIYLCRACEAWVGVHQGSYKALGRLANKELRTLKMEAHAKFDKLWKQLLKFDYSVSKSRLMCYSWLAEKMNLPIELTHIGMFDEQQCKTVVELVKELNFKGGVSAMLTKEERKLKMEAQQNVPEQQVTEPKQETAKERYLKKVSDQLTSLANELQVTITHLAPTQIRVGNGTIALDIYPVNRKYHNLLTNERGGYYYVDDLVYHFFKTP